VFKQQFNRRSGGVASSRPLPASRLALLGATAAVALALAGCKGDTGVTGSIVPTDYRVRHPIALTYAPTTLDVFLSRNMAGLDPRQAEDVRAFAADYRRAGRGPMTMLVPTDPAAAAASQRAATAVRSALSRAGVGPAFLQLQRYPGGGDGLADPIRLSYAKMQAKVTSECGTWRSDISGNPASTEGWQNTPHYDFGCSYQTMLANQVDDPIDFQRARQEDRADVLRRMKVFDDARKGTDPSTIWKTDAAKVTGSSGGN
jgi:pilus assembly protein CpaD